MQHGAGRKERRKRERGTPGPAAAAHLPSAMPPVFRSLFFGFLMLLVVLLIIDDIAEVEKESK